MITTRLASEKDLNKLADIYVRAYNSINIGENWTHESSYQLLEYCFKEQSDLFFVAEVEGDLAGAMVAFVKPWWDGNHLTDGELFVDPDFQKMGIGRKLIKDTFTKALDNYNAVAWDTFTHRVYEHPLTWYKSLGFEEVKEWVMISGNIKKVLDNLKRK